MKRLKQPNRLIILLKNRVIVRGVFSIVTGFAVLKLFLIHSTVSRFSCQLLSEPLPYFHTKVNYTEGVILWNHSCHELENEQKVNGDLGQFLSCNADDKPFSHCEFKNILLEEIETDRNQVWEPGLKDTDKDGLTAHGLQFSIFHSKKRRSKAVFIRNIIDIERQQLPRNRDVTNAAEWPVITKKFGAVIKHIDDRTCMHHYKHPVFLLYAYHTWNIWHLHEGLFRLWRTMKSYGLLGSAVTVIRADKEQNIFHHKEYLDVFAFVKWQHISEIPKNSCFEEMYVVGYPQHMFDKRQHRIADVAEYRAFMMQGLGIKEEEDCFTNETRVTFISRRNRMMRQTKDERIPPGNRHLRNEEDLIKRINSHFKFKARAYSFEQMSKYNQVQIICSSDILIGVHSGALLNILWLKPRSLLLQTQVPGAEYGTREIWRRPRILVQQGIGFYDMEQLSMNIGAHYGTLYSRDYQGPGKDVEKCKNLYIKDLSVCFSIFKKERSLFSKGVIFSVSFEDLAAEIESWLNS